MLMQLRRLTLLFVASALVLAGCGDSAPSWKDPGGGSSAATDTVKVTAPADGAADVSTATSITFAASSDASVSLQDASGTPIEGAVVPPSSSASPASPAPGGVEWMPAKQLKYATEYTATVTSGKAKSTVKFTTMAKPSSLVRTSSQIGDGQVVGVGMMMILSFGTEIPKDKRAGIEKRLFMTSDPPQVGSWNWYTSKEIHYRPKEYWQAGTKLSLRAAVGGVSYGGKSYGEKDLTVDATVGKKLIMEVDNATKQMTVTEDGTVLKTMPVSLGKPSNPSDSGNFIVMVKNEWEWFDSSTYGVPVDSPDGYRTKVEYPQRITWSGQYIHAAPWSVKDQGKRNVSHGCVNISLELAKWLYGVTHIGDPVIVKGTEERVKYGDGWTDWELSWEEYQKGSAL
ncbi:Ig-like domain-containing protein [Dactylosporangium siamense]|uniref:Conserved lipoprotein LppS n=2 Tax=Dactylosporangium siamense TaxID=685454 RepID=A0A919PWS6_9ACTN|nr:putative conserved lipoprotein LppS [Dactylosporangium siamense]